MGAKFRNISWDWGTGGLATTFSRGRVSRAPGPANGTRPTVGIGSCKQCQALHLTPEADLFLLSHSERAAACALILPAMAALVFSAPCAWRSETYTLGWAEIFVDREEVGCMWVWF